MAKALISARFFVSSNVTQDATNHSGWGSGRPSHNFVEIALDEHLVPGCLQRFDPVGAPLNTSASGGVG